MPESCQITHRLHALYSFFQAKHALEKWSQDGVIKKKIILFQRKFMFVAWYTPDWVIYLPGKKNKKY